MRAEAIGQRFCTISSIVFFTTPDFTIEEFEKF